MDRKKPRQLSASSSKDEECLCCPSSRLCTCTTSTTTYPSSSQSVAGSTEPVDDTSMSLEGDRFEESTVSSSDQEVKQEKERDTFWPWDLLGNSCWIGKGDENEEVEIFVSDDEDEVADPGVGDNEDGDKVEEMDAREDLDGLQSKCRKIALEKALLEEDQKWLISERIRQERELAEAKDCVKALKEEIEGHKEQQLRERETMKRALENAKVSNRVLREKMELLQETTKENQEMLRRENSTLRAEMHRLTLALAKGEEGSRRTIQSAVWEHWECPTCTFHNQAGNLSCDMCRCYGVNI